MPMAECRRNDPDYMLRGVSHQRQLAWLKNGVAVVHRRYHEVMQICGKDERYADQCQKIPDQKPLLVLRRINGGDKSKPKLLGNDGAGDLQGRNRKSCR